MLMVMVMVLVMAMIILKMETIPFLDHRHRVINGQYLDYGMLWSVPLETVLIYIVHQFE